jgi:uncharacterized protein YheU (UPF0270 family)
MKFNTYYKLVQGLELTEQEKKEFLLRRGITKGEHYDSLDEIRIVSNQQEGDEQVVLVVNEIRDTYCIICNAGVSEWGNYPPPEIEDWMNIQED